MKIGIDVSMLVYQGSGVATYTYNFVKNLLKYDKKNEYRLFYSSLRRPKDFYYLNEFRKLGAKVFNYPFPPRLLKLFWNKWHILPVEWLIGKVDVYHSSDYLRPPLLKGTKSITTLHDLTWKLFPQYHTQDVISAHENKLKKTIKYKYKIKFPSNFLLYVGAIEPRKNLTTAIKVFDTLIKGKKYSDFKFLIVGRAGWKNKKVFNLIRDFKLEKKVIFVGYVNDVDLPYFYNAARVFIYLSLYEGFGLPPLEAAKCKTPSLLYKNSSIKEILPKNYPYAKRQKEIKSLLYLLESGIKISLTGGKTTWKSYYMKFIS